MFKLSTVETKNHRRLVLEGTLVAPWTLELERAWHLAQEHLHGRELVVDLGNVTRISRDGEDALFKLMQDGAKFKCEGVMNKHLLRQLARKCRCQPSSNPGRSEIGEERSHQAISTGSSPTLEAEDK